MRGAGIFKAVVIISAVYTGGLNAQNVKAGFIADKNMATTDNAVFNFKNTSSGATQYRWLTGDGTVVGTSKDLTWEFSDIGFYKIGLVAYNKFSIDTSFFEIEVIRGTNFGNTLVDPTAAVPIPTTSYSKSEK